MAIFIATCFIASREAMAQQRYVITDLGKLGGSASYGFDIDGNGHVTGWSETNQTGANGSAIRNPFVWQRGIMSGLPTLASGKGAMAVAIASSGTDLFGYPANIFTGEAETSSGSTHAFRYDESFLGGGMLDLNYLPNISESHGRDVNSSGQVAGWALTNGGTQIAFFYDNSHGMTDISGGSPRSAAYGINNAGQVVGYMQTTGGVDHAFIYNISTRQRRDLGSTTGYPYSYALGINDSKGYVIGYVSVKLVLDQTLGGYLGFIYDGKNFRTIGNTANIARAINNSGQVVGSFKTAGNIDHAFLYQNGQMTDLNTLIPATSGWVVSVANSISDAGQIVGYGTIGGEQHAFLMTQVPTYTATEIPLTPPSTPDDLLRINSRGQVVGVSAAGRAAVCQLVNGQPSLTELSTDPSHAFGINDFGEVVGESVSHSQNSQGLIHAFKWTGNTLAPIDLNGPGETGSARGTNIIGNVVGQFTPSNSIHTHAFYCSHNFRMSDIGTLPGGFTDSSATNINILDQVVGFSSVPGSFTGGGNAQAFYWTNSTSITGLPPLVGTASLAWDINNTGQVVGWSGTNSSSGGIPGPGHACIWMKDNQGRWQVQDLGSLSGFQATCLCDDSQAFSINNLGQAVGISNSPVDGSPRAIIWYNGTMIDLNTLLPPNSGWVLTDATDINDSGQIVGIGLHNNQLAVFLLTR